MGWRAVFIGGIWRIREDIGREEIVQAGKELRQHRVCVTFSWRSAVRGIDRAVQT